MPSALCAWQSCKIIFIELYGSIYIETIIEIQSLYSKIPKEGFDQLNQDNIDSK
jgi:hypothetical protein